MASPTFLWMLRLSCLEAAEGQRGKDTTQIRTPGRKIGHSFGWGPGVGTLERTLSPCPRPGSHSKSSKGPLLSLQGLARPESPEKPGGEESKPGKRPVAWLVPFHPCPGRRGEGPMAPATLLASGGSGPRSLARPARASLPSPPLPPPSLPIWS